MGILKTLLSAAAAYVPTNWVTGDTITAERLNHMEEGIENASGSFVLPIIRRLDGTCVLDCEYADIVDAVSNNKKISAKLTREAGSGPDSIVLIPNINYQFYESNLMNLACYYIEIFPATNALTFSYYYINGDSSIIETVKSYSLTELT
jgi:hypothetical protein